MDKVLQDHLPSAPWKAEATRRLPGLKPLEGYHDWLPTDEAFAGQMAVRERLLAERRDEVIAQVPGSEAAVAELYEEVLYYLGGGRGYDWDAEGCIRPDGVHVRLNERDKLGTLARLVQQDLCVLEKPEGAEEHVLTAAALCFPASWTLAEKIGRPLSYIHGPVFEYDGVMARRVQRVFDNLRDDTPVWRQNALIYDDPALFQPRRMAAPRVRKAGAGYLRSERQVLLRLIETRAIVFSIHTYVVPMESLTPDQRAGLDGVGHVT
ncbi:DUF3445 domain-containing protein [Gymnodinialimonas hymeniacidonis]|uniref:heme-dependent oxidative N-demethylase family protein n=1 Tax=Gymnodinialimonas hymeniacidonis TaxID=3126508 RepID=UPI0034C6D943